MPHVRCRLPSAVTESGDKHRQTVLARPASRSPFLQSSANHPPCHELLPPPPFRGGKSNSTCTGQEQCQAAAFRAQTEPIYPALPRGITSRGESIARWLSVFAADEFFLERHKLQDVCPKQNEHHSSPFENHQSLKVNASQSFSTANSFLIQS